MLNTISWQAYWMAVAFTTACYYGTIFLLYFRKHLNFSSSKLSSYQQGSFTTASYKDQRLSNNDPDDEFTPPPTGSAEQLVYACVDEVNAFIQEARRIKTGKEDFIISIKSILAKYPTIHSTEYKGAISKVIISEAAHHCSIHLSEAEVDSVWLG